MYTVVFFKVGERREEGEGKRKSSMKQHVRRPKRESPLFWKAQIMRGAVMIEETDVLAAQVLLAVGRRRGRGIM